MFLDVPQYLWFITTLKGEIQQICSLEAQIQMLQLNQFIAIILKRATYCMLITTNIRP